MKCYKLTDSNLWTFNETKWGEGISHEIKGELGNFCSDSCIHFYLNKYLAVLLNPIHSNIQNPLLWLAKAEEPIKNDRGLKFGTRKLTTLKIVEIPKFSLNQRIYFGILCARGVCNDKSWNLWADKWIKGDRKENAATTNGGSIHNASPYAAYSAAFYSGTSDIAKAYAADAAYFAVFVNCKLNLPKLALKAYNWKE